MKRTSRTLMMMAAMSGLISGSTLHQCQADPTNVVPGKVAPDKKAPTAHGCAGQNDCKGIGGCKTESHACKFQNSCKGKGGCEVTQKDIKVWEKQQEDAAKANAKEPGKESPKSAKP